MGSDDRGAQDALPRRGRRVTTVERAAEELAGDLVAAVTLRNQSPDVTRDSHTRVENRQQDLTDVAVAAALERIIPVVEAALARVADRFLSEVVADGRPIDKSDTQPIVGMWNEEIPALAEALTRIYTGAGNVTMRAFSGPEHLTDALRSGYLSEAANRLQDVGNDLWRE